MPPAQQTMNGRNFRKVGSFGPRRDDVSPNPPQASNTNMQTSQPQTMFSSNQNSTTQNNQMPFQFTSQPTNFNTMNKPLNTQPQTNFLAANNPPSLQSNNPNPLSNPQSNPIFIGQQPLLNTGFPTQPPQQTLAISQPQNIAYTFQKPIQQVNTLGLAQNVTSAPGSSSMSNAPANIASIGNNLSLQSQQQQQQQPSFGVKIGMNQGQVNAPNDENVKNNTSEIASKLIHNMKQRLFEKKYVFQEDITHLSQGKKNIRLYHNTLKQQ